MFSIPTDNPALSLALANPDFGEALFHVVDSNRAYLKTWLPWLDHNRSVQDSEDFLRHSLQGYFAKTSLTTLLMFHSKVIGTVGFNNIRRENQEAEIGYWLDQNSTGQGYMNNALRTLIEVGFQQYQLNRLVIRVAVGNEPSRRVAKRLGFQFEGVARQAAPHYGNYLDLEVYSLLKCHWAQNASA